MFMSKVCHHGQYVWVSDLVPILIYPCAQSEIGCFIQYPTTRALLHSAVKMKNQCTLKIIITHALYCKGQSNRTTFTRSNNIIPIHYKNFSICSANLSMQRMSWHFVSGCLICLPCTLKRVRWKKLTLQYKKLDKSHWQIYRKLVQGPL